MKQLVFGRRILTGTGSLEAVNNYAGERVFIVTGSHSAFASGAIDRLTNALGEREVEIYSGITKNPTVRAVEDGAAAMKKFAPDTVIAIGGGSPLDAAKVMTLLYEHPELTCEAAAGITLPSTRRTRFIAVPTTSGTASEVTRAAVITYEEQEIKIGLKTDAFIPDIAILDGTLTLSMPPHVAAETGMDALTHAVEAYCNHNLDTFTKALAEEAILGIFANLPAACAHAALEARQAMHEYQAMAGLAFTNVGLGMSHGIAHAVGGKFGLGHGLINAIVLPYAIRYNEGDAQVAEKIAHLEARLERPFADAVDELNRTLGIPRGLKEAGITEADWQDGWDDFIANCLAGSTRSNPRPIAADVMSELMHRIYRGA